MKLGAELLRVSFIWEEVPLKKNYEYGTIMKKQRERGSQYVSMVDNWGYKNRYVSFLG